MIKDSKIILFVLVALLGFIFNSLQLGALIMGLLYIVNIFYASKNTIAFREYTLAIYALNYLISPAILYNYNDSDFLFYKMNCPIDTYFMNSICGMLAFHLGIFAFSTNVFKTNFKLAKIQAILNEKVLITWLIAGLLLNIINTFFSLPAEITFFILLLSGLRYVGLFGLFALDAKKHKKIIIIVIVYEFYWALTQGFFHDLLIWSIFFGLYFVYLKKINFLIKIVLGLALILFGYTIQNVKAEYRNKIWNEGEGDNTIGAFANVTASKTANTEVFFSTQTMLTTLIRVNQGWIAASAIDKADQTQHFAGTTLLVQYIEAALLPRFLAPNKLNAGDKKIFNEYSGHTIAEGTSMGLGIIADGYVSFAFWGVVWYCFGLGLLFSIIFKIVEKWGEISPFFVLTLFPILYYAVRPDCELQTTLGQLVKSTFTFWLVVKYYKSYFEKQAKVLQRIEDLLAKKKLALRS